MHQQIESSKDLLKSYHSPKVTIFGAIMDITQGGTGTGDDAFFQSTFDNGK